MRPTTVFLSMTTRLGRTPSAMGVARLEASTLENMDAVRRFGPGSSHSDNADTPLLFPSLETLYVENLPGLQEWDNADDYIWFPHHRELNISGFLELRKITCLPFSLKKFHMDKVGLTSLEVLNIVECPEILYRESTGEEEEEDGNLLPSSLTLSLWECNDLISLRGLHSIRSLRKLEIRDCPKLLEATVDLPASLTLLQLSRCNLCHEWLSQCLQGLTSLSTLLISQCPKILSLPKAELLFHLTALERLDLVKCDELQEVDSLRALASLESLRISRCPKLLAAASSTQQPSADKQRETQKERGTLQSLLRIEIDSILYLLILPVPKGIVSISVDNNFGHNEDYLPKLTLIPVELEEWLLQCHDSLQY